jgi:CheY-like chemotaxis protein
MSTQHHTRRGRSRERGSPAPHDRPSVAVGERNRCRSHVLLVDDDRDVRETLAALLEFEGYHVIAASNGQEALSLLQTGPPPSLILLDLLMPVMDGFEFRRLQRAHSSWASLPTVVMTAVDDPVIETSMVGAVECLTKPFDVAHLLALVARFCA